MRSKRRPIPLNKSSQPCAQIYYGRISLYRQSQKDDENPLMFVYQSHSLTIKGSSKIIPTFFKMKTNLDFIVLFESQLVTSYLSYLEFSTNKQKGRKQLRDSLRSVSNLKGIGNLPIKAVARHQNHNLHVPHNFQGCLRLSFIALLSNLCSILEQESRKEISGAPGWLSC